MPEKTDRYGAQIYSLHGLAVYVRQKRAVVSPKSGNLKGPLPAAFVINLSGWIILRMIEHGLFVYEKGKKDA